jgi:HAD superfamily hydrolase (TIGR01549 family)
MTTNKIGERAAIFDFDGTLVDSYAPRKSAQMKVSELLLARLKLQGRESERRSMAEIIAGIEKQSHKKRGYDRNLWWREALRQYAGKNIRVSESILSEASDLYWEIVMKGTELFPGVKSMLQALKVEGLKLGLISDTDGIKGLKAKRIEVSGLRPNFDAIVVAGEDTSDVKPSMQPFSMACRLLKVPPENGVFIGDDPETDISGPQQLGIRVIIVRSRFTIRKDDIQGAQLVERENLLRGIMDAIEK